MFKHSIAIFSLLLISFTFSAQNSFAAGNEGFFPLDQLPIKRLIKYGMSERKIRKLAKTVALLEVDHAVEQDFTEQQVLSARTGSCAPQYANDYLHAFCEKIWSSACDHGCDPNWTGIMASVFVGPYLVTGNHGSFLKDTLDGKTPWATYRAADGTLARVELEETPYSDHVVPYDISIFKIKGPLPPVPSVRIRSDDMYQGEGVFGVGFPGSYLRKEISGKYQRAAYDLRATIGEVTNANRTHESFCNFSNDNDDAQNPPESWVLQPGCDGTVPIDADAREERNPVLTDSDMINGMSGSPLFDNRGRLVGMGSQVLSTNYTEYQIGHYAVYAKGYVVEELIRELSGR